MDLRIVDFRKALDAQPISRLQLWILAEALILLLTDGYDAQSIAFVAPVMAKDLHLSRAVLGPVFSSGLLGLTLGAMLFAPLADRFGSRRILAVCTLIYGVFTLATLWVTTFRMLIAVRLITGLGLGGIMPNAVGVVAEYMPTRLRTTMVTITVCGFPLGGVVGGVISATMIARFGWHSVFLVGALVPLVSLPMILKLFPEGLLHLLNTPSRSAELCQLVSRLAPGWEPPREIEHSGGVDAPRVPVRLLFEGGYASRTVFLWVAFFMNLILLYFIVNWLPSVLNAGGLSLEKASVTAALYNVGGIVGALVLAFFCDLVAPQQVLCGAFMGSAAFLLIIAWSSGSAFLLMASAVGAGFCTIGGQIAMDAFTSAYYPAAARATGLGWALGIGRLGSILGPLIGGILIGMNISGANVFRLFTIPALITAVAILLVQRPPKLSSEPTGQARLISH